MNRGRNNLIDIFWEIKCVLFVALVIFIGSSSSNNNSKRMLLFLIIKIEYFEKISFKNSIFTFTFWLAKIIYFVITTNMKSGSVMYIFKNLKFATLYTWICRNTEISWTCVFTCMNVDRKFNRIFLFEKLEGNNYEISIITDWSFGKLWLS